MTTSFLVGDVFERMAELDDGSFDLIVTSPPFLALRSYLPENHPDKNLEIGSEATPADYLDTLLALTAEWRRLLTPHGSIAIELGDTYAGSGGAGGDYDNEGMRDGQPRFTGSAARTAPNGKRHPSGNGPGWPLDKSLTGIPTLYAWSLAYGRNLLTGQPSPAGRWRVRNVKPWIRSNPPVGALGDKERPATSYITVACTGRDRWFDLDAVRTTAIDQRFRSTNGAKNAEADSTFVQTGNYDERVPSNPGGAPPLDWWHHVDAIIDAVLDDRAGKRSTGGKSEKWQHASDPIVARRDHEPYEGPGGARGVHIRRALERAGILTTLDAYDVSPKGYAGAHYAVWPPELVKLLVQEMCPPGGTVLDPFVGSGTTLMVCSGLGRNSVGIDIDERNADLARERCGMFLEVDYSDREVPA